MTLTGVESLTMMEDTWGRFGAVTRPFRRNILAMPLRTSRQDAPIWRQERLHLSRAPGFQETGSPFRDLTMLCLSIFSQLKNRSYHST